MACLAVRHPFACRSLQSLNGYRSERFRTRSHILHGFLNVGAMRQLRTHNIRPRDRLNLFSRRYCQPATSQRSWRRSTGYYRCHSRYGEEGPSWHGLVLPQPVNQPHIQFVPDQPPEPASQPSIQAAVRTNIQTFTGGILQVAEPTIDSSKNSFISGAVPLASRVPEHRNKI